MTDIADLINECEYLFLRSVSEPKEGELCVVVEEGKAQTQSSVDQSNYPVELSEILSDATCRRFEITFPEYIQYTVMNESFGKYPKEPERFEGKLFRRFLFSHLLELVKKTSYASDDYPEPGQLQHYELSCQDRIVDVITPHPPQIKLLQPS